MLTSEPRFVAGGGEDGRSVGKETGYAMEAAAGASTVGLASRDGDLATPSPTVLALAAEPEQVVGDSTAWALTTPLVGEYDDESEIVHPNLPLLGAIRSVRIDSFALYEQSAATGEDAVTTC